MRISSGNLFRQALSKNEILQIPGTINAYHALLAKQSGFICQVAVSLPDRWGFWIWGFPPLMMSLLMCGGLPMFAIYRCWLILILVLAVFSISSAPLKA